MKKTKHQTHLGTEQQLPASINIHPLTACNMACTYCHGQFASAKSASLSFDDMREILRQIAALPVPKNGRPRKVTFAGGEPLLYPDIFDAVAFAKELGLVTSIVTNGLLLDATRIARLAPVLDWAAISVDSLTPDTNRGIGRCTPVGRCLSAEEYLQRAHSLRDAGIKLKINTVVSRFNCHEDLSSFIAEACPLRWKILQASCMEGENDARAAEWTISKEMYNAFVARHEHLKNKSITLVPEEQSQIHGTYAAITPNGAFLKNADGKCRYTRPILEVGIRAAFAEADFSQHGFEARQGEYDFHTGSSLPQPEIRQTPEIAKPTLPMTLRELATTNAKCFRAVPIAYRVKLRHICQAIGKNKKQPWHFRGKRLLHCRRDYASIPIGRRWRAIFRETASDWIFQDCLSHERYNKFLELLKKNGNVRSHSY
jgi:radical S-adenosyl methionine domain-containing protein 2